MITGDPQARADLLQAVAADSCALLCLDVAATTVRVEVSPCYLHGYSTIQHHTCSFYPTPPNTQGIQAISFSFGLILTLPWVNKKTEIIHQQIMCILQL